MESKDQSKQSMNQILLTPWKIKKYEKLIECNHSLSGESCASHFYAYKGHTCI